MSSASTAAARGNPLTPLERLKTVPRVPLMIGGALVLALLIAIALWSRAPEYRVLFANLNERDGGAIVAELTRANVPYRFADGSAALMVPADRVHEVRLQLASQGLPRGGSVGFELLDNAKFGASQFTEQVNYQRALEGELARSVEAMHAVESARVHLALPRQSLFVRERQAPSASVLVNLFHGRVLDDAQIAAVAHLVSSSVPELAVSNISIVDQYGRLLSQPAGEGRGLDDSQFRRIRDIEQSYAQRIEALLTPLLGPGNARAQVSAELDFSRREETQESYGPNQQPGTAAIRSRQTSESTQLGSDLAQGIPGALSNQPPLEPVAPIVAPTGEAVTPPVQEPGQAPDAGNTTSAMAGGSARRDATTNYEVDRTILHLQHAVGTISRLSVAVIVNHLPDENGEPQPLPANDLEQLRELVKQAMGFSAARGDSLNIMNSPFAVVKTPDIPWWQDPSYVELARSAGFWLIVLILVTWLWLGIGRPLMQRQLAQPVPPSHAPDDDAAQSAEEEAMAADIRARKLSRYEDSLQTARDLATKDPSAVAAVIRTWMEKDE